MVLCRKLPKLVLKLTLQASSNVKLGNHGGRPLAVGPALFPALIAD
jgi:hypothetical protein